MKCPFRKEENGDFADCYGARCMGYSEIAPVVVVPACKPLEKIRACRMMGTPYPPAGGCGC